MKKKLFIGIAAIATTCLFFSFKQGEKEGTNTAIVTPVDGKGDNSGFLIMYGDGSMEIKKFDFKSGSENMIQGEATLAVVMNELYQKGYRYAGSGGYTHKAGGFVFPLTFMVFEKK